MPGNGMFDKILEFETALAEYTGAPYAVMTDCCTHAIELCLFCFDSANPGHRIGRSRRTRRHRLYGSVQSNLATECSSAVELLLSLLCQAWKFYPNSTIWSADTRHAL